MKKAIRSYRVELIALTVAVVGACLLLAGLSSTPAVDQVSVDAARRSMSAVLIGAMLVAGAGAFIVWRVRVRFLSSAYWCATVCPLCGSPIHHVHRSLLEKAASEVFLPHARRYQCEQAECGWSSLRYSRRHGTMKN
jgi:hypothetical protein